jgi:hypothetical protein
LFPLPQGAGQGEGYVSLKRRVPKSPYPRI